MTYLVKCGSFAEKSCEDILGKVLFICRKVLLRRTWYSAAHLPKALVRTYLVKCCSMAKRSFYDVVGKVLFNCQKVAI